MTRQICAILCALAAGAFADVPTFGRDIAPLLKAKCGACHTGRGVAPFPLDVFAEARQRAGKLARITLDGLMPPWLPANHGFARDRRLSAEEVALLRRWAEAGAPEGDPITPAPRRAEAWQLGKPDLVLTMPRFHTVPAEGELQTTHYVFPLKLKQARHLRAVEVLPGNRRVVLQVNVLFDRSGRARELAGKDGWYARFGSSGFFPSGRIAAFTPDRASFAYDPGVAMTLPPDTDAVVQIRYRPAGEKEMDLTRVGFFFAKEAPQRHPSGVFLGNEDLRLAPGAMEEVIRDRVTLTAPIEARDIRPNLLRFGRAVRAWAEPPGGKRILLLDIHDWNFDWQETYTFAEPIALPKGTVIHTEWTLSNPAAAELRAGDTPDAEAPALWLGGTVGTWAEHVALTGANLAHYTELMNAALRRR